MKKDVEKLLEAIKKEPGATVNRVKLIKTIQTILERGKHGKGNIQHK